MDDTKGVYAIARSIWSHPDFSGEPFTQREAWMWLVGAAAWKAIRVRGSAGPVSLERGEFTFSVRFLGEKFQWTKDKTHRFLKMLQKRDMIRDSNRDGSKVYSIIKYNDFQIVGLPKRDDERDEMCEANATAPRQHRDKEEELKKDKKEDIIILPAWLPLVEWEAYLSMRRRIRKPATEDAVKLVLAKLDRWRQLGHDPTAILNYSIENSYQGIFEPKASDNGKRNHQEKRTATDQHMAGISDLANELRARRSAGSA